MKRIIVLIVLLSVSSLGLAQTQKEKPGIVERNSKGIIASVEFRDSEKGKSPNTAKDFFTQYLEVKESDHFEKVPHQSKQPNFVHEHIRPVLQRVKSRGCWLQSPF